MYLYHYILKAINFIVRKVRFLCLAIHLNDNLKYTHHTELLVIGSCCFFDRDYRETCFEMYPRYHCHRQQVVVSLWGI